MYLDRLLLGSVSEEIIRHSKIPVLTVGTYVNPPNNKNEVVKLLVATDLGINSRNAEKYALELAKKLQAQVVLIHCLTEGFHPVLQTAFSSPAGNRKLVDLFDTIKSETEVKLERAKKRFTDRGIVCKTILDATSTSATTSILKNSESQKSRFIILGTHGRNYLANTLLGSTARAAILQAHQPVITVRSR
jgi:nucleotide-binding universal stress UspA family protein